jgi:hypothetical protein
MNFSEGGMIAAGCPGHEADFISEHADEIICIASIGQFCMPQKTLQVKMAHLTRCATYEHMQGGAFH